MRHVQLVALLLLVAESNLVAQRIEDGRVAASNAESTDVVRQIDATRVNAFSPTSASTRSMVAGGIVGGVLGAFAGASVGISVENCDRKPRETNCGIAGAAIGALLGEAVGVPIGVNWAADGHGTLGHSIPVSLGVTAVCLVMGYMTAGTSVIAMPVMQIYTAIRTERTGKSGFMGR